MLAQLEGPQKGSYYADHPGMKQLQSNNDYLVTNKEEPDDGGSVKCPEEAYIYDRLPFDSQEQANWNPYE